MMHTGVVAAMPHLTYLHNSSNGNLVVCLLLSGYSEHTCVLIEAHDCIGVLAFGSMYTDLVAYILNWTELGRWLR